MKYLLLESGFYAVKAFTASDDEINSDITIDPQHEIFKGHFPGQPIVPGVCMIQMIKELVEKKNEKECRLTICGQVKFLNPLVPNRDAVINVLIKCKNQGDANVKIDAIISNNGVVILKMSNGIIV